MVENPREHGRAPNKNEQLYDRIERVLVETRQTYSQIADAFGVDRACVDRVQSRRGVRQFEQSDAARALDPAIDD